MSSRGRTLRPASFPKLTVRGVAFMVVASGAVLLSYALDRRELLYLGCLLALFPLCAAALLVLTTPRLSARRAFEPDAVEVDRTVTVKLDVRNMRSVATSESSWYDPVPDGAGVQPTAALPVLAGRGSTRLTYALRPERRGTFPIGPLAVVSQDPFGLVTLSTTVGGSSPLVVTPRVTPLPEVFLGHARSYGSATQFHRQGTLGDDDLITREYRPGDAKRRVHWRATARHGGLMVRQEEPRSNPEAVLFLDTRPRSYPDARGIGLFETGLHVANDFERAIEVGASVALHLQRVGYGVDVLQSTSMRRSLLQPHDGFSADGGSDEFLARLAALDVSAATREIDFLGRLRGELRRFGPATPLFAVLGALGPADAKRLAELRSMSEPAIAFVVTDDPSTGDPSTGDPSTGDTEPLVAAGWLCVRVGSAGDLGRAWQSTLSAGAG